MLDLANLTPAPWKEFPFQSTAFGTEFKKADEEFAVLARNAFDVMMRLGWWPCPGIHSEKGLLWKVETVAQYTDQAVDGKWWPDPFTALVEADKWYRENVEK